MQGRKISRLTHGGFWLPLGLPRGHTFNTCLLLNLLIKSWTDMKWWTKHGRTYFQTWRLRSESQILLVPWGSEPRGSVSTILDCRAAALSWCSIATHLRSLQLPTWKTCHSSRRLDLLQCTVFSRAQSSRHPYNLHQQLLQVVNLVQKPRLSEDLPPPFPQPNN